jgi:hypothetical protein
VFLIDTNDPTLSDSIDETFSEDISVEDDQNILNEVSLSISDPNVLVLKKSTDVYYERYKKALIVARKLKKEAMDAHMNAIQIKTSYELEDIELSDYED